MTNYVLTVTCKSTRGIVAAISNYLAEKGCNIVDSSQFDDLDTGRFFTRVSFISEEGVKLPPLVAGFNGQDVVGGGARRGSTPAPPL